MPLISRKLRSSPNKSFQLGLLGEARSINGEYVTTLLVGAQEVALGLDRLEVLRLLPELVLEVVLQRIHILLGL